MQGLLQLGIRSSLVLLETDIQVLSGHSTDAVVVVPRLLTVLHHGGDIVTVAHAIVGQHGSYDRALRKRETAMYGSWSSSKCVSVGRRWHCNGNCYVSC